MPSASPDDDIQAALSPCHEISYLCFRHNKQVEESVFLPRVFRHYWGFRNRLYNNGGGRKMFKTYKNINRDSNVASYEIGADYIGVKFLGTPYVYYYSYKSPGKEHVEKMKILAEIGDGLNSYINTNCRFLFEKKVRLD